MADYLCPNDANVPNHPRRVLYSDKLDLSAAAVVRLFGHFMRVPKPAYCDVCQRGYLKSECIEADR